ncbi:MAG: 2,6-dihydroxypyridine 3-monooxygenase [Stenotrophomonas maltophilia]|uniref:2,6-dihydroxypyridine 3-monooxygenase n=1 Tax=Stenotrophomonas maltophilia TaxID=40324 RepID=A0A7V8FFV5_STEMA|nr:MAG: 2,6-dihydroxypyridine 3-monooxygenase [Stenotrophomonas maltophilia]
MIVGASLAGLMSALALSRIGMAVTMMECADGKAREDAALPVSDGLLQRLMGHGAAQQHTLPSGSQAWADVYTGLQAAVAADAGIDMRASTRVARIEQDERSAWAVTDGGDIMRGDIVVGADGHASVVRRHVCPDQPDAVFAGYLIWLGIVDESEVKAKPSPDGLAILDEGGYCLNAYYLPGRDGSIAPGRRRIEFGWYDAGRNDLLQASGAVVDNVVQRTLRSKDIPNAVFSELAAQARTLWPNPWRTAILDCIERRALIGTPIGEYMPTRLTRGRVCLVGDAAHVPSPMTGRGFDASSLDALALADVLQDRSALEDYAQALRRYEARQLSPARDLVRSGYGFSRSFASSPAA